MFLKLVIFFYCIIIDYTCQILFKLLLFTNLLSLHYYFLQVYSFQVKIPSLTYTMKVINIAFKFLFNNIISFNPTKLVYSQFYCFSPMNITNQFDF